VSGRLGALAAAVAGEVATRARRAFLLALGAGLLAVFALGGSILPVEVAANLLLTYVLFLGVFALALAALLMQQFGGAFGDALAVGGWARLEAEARWRRHGAGRIPRSPEEGRRWLDAHPDTTTLVAERFSAQLVCGDLVAARGTLENRPIDTPYGRFDVASDGWFLDFVDGAIPPLDDVVRLSGDIVDPSERRVADAALATLRAHEAVALGGDWVAALAGGRAQLGDAASGIIGSRYILPAWTVSVAIAALLIGGALIVGRATGVWR
jgi:hypothetical protein